MKKSLLALALAAAAFGAQAANVEVYGVVDTGLMYAKQSASFDRLNLTAGAASIDDQDTFGLQSGINAGSRFGLKGTEDLGNGMKVSFKLENGFDADKGTFSQEDKLFGREASLTVSGGFGDISFGRMGGLTSSAGTYDIYALYSDAFDGGDNNIVSGFAMSSRYDNMISYASPEMAGVKLYAQYSFQQTGDETDQVSNNDRYMALGATYNLGNLGLIAVVDSFQHANTAGNPKDDGLTFNFGANYDCGFAKTFAGFQVARNVKDIANLGVAKDFVAGQLNENQANEFNGVLSTTNGFDGWAMTVGTIVPVGTGSFTAALYYADAEEASAFEAGANKAEASYIGLAARYTYPLSARTSVYTGAGWSKTKAEYNAKNESFSFDEDLKTVQAYVGLTHAF